MGVHSIKNVPKIFFFLEALNFSAFYFPLATLDDDFCVLYGNFPLVIVPILVSLRKEIFILYISYCNSSHHTTNY